MKAFYCKKCEQFKADAYTEQVKTCYTGFTKDGKLSNFIWDCNCDSLEENYKPKENQKFECNECENQMEIVELKDCPHIWKTRVNERECELCDKKERGEVTFK